MRFGRLLNGFAVQRDVETFFFALIGRTQADDGLDDQEDDGRGNRRVDQGHGDAVDLGHDAGVFAELVDRSVSEHTGQDRADDAANAVDAEGVERVVITEHLLDVDRREVTSDAGNDADDQRARRIDEARSGSDRDETGNRTGDDAEDARLLGDHPFSEQK